MLISIRTTNSRMAMLFGLILMLVWPISSFAQARGNGNGRGSNLDKKCAKFVNCHDARDGRWDGRGPAVQNNQPTDTDIFRNRRNRDRDRDDEIFNRRTRNRQIDRDGDGDVDRDDAILARRERNRRVNRDDNQSDGSWRRRHERRADSDNRQTRVRRHARADTD